MRVMTESNHNNDGECLERENQNHTNNNDESQAESHRRIIIDDDDSYDDDAYYSISHSDAEEKNQQPSEEESNAMLLASLNVSLSINSHSGESSESLLKKDKNDKDNSGGDMMMRHIRVSKVASSTPLTSPSKPLIEQHSPLFMQMNQYDMCYHQSSEADKKHSDSLLAMTIVEEILHVLDSTIISKDIRNPSSLDEHRYRELFDLSKVLSLDSHSNLINDQVLLAMQPGIERMEQGL